MHLTICVKSEEVFGLLDDLRRLHNHHEKPMPTRGGGGGTRAAASYTIFAATSSSLYVNEHAEVVAMAISEQFSIAPQETSENKYRHTNLDECKPLRGGLGLCIK